MSSHYSTARFERDVFTWLTYEKATAEETEVLLFALLGGAIEGRVYGVPLIQAAPEPVLAECREVKHMKESEDIPYAPECGCLLGTLGQSRGFVDGRAHLGRMGENSPGARAGRRVFAYAQKIPTGATPTTNRWARAAFQGVSRYLESLPPNQETTNPTEEENVVGATAG